MSYRSINREVDMPQWIKNVLIAIVTKIIDQYVTDEIIQEFETKAKEYMCDRLDEFAASTEWTEVDDVFAAKVRKALLG